MSVTAPKHCRAARLLAETVRLRPWLGDILKCPENGRPKRQNPTTFLARHGNGRKCCGRAVCSCLHQRSADAGDAEPGHAGVRRAARLNHRPASPRSELGGREARSPRETDRGRPPTRDRRGAGLASGSLGRSVTDLLATLHELEHLDVGFVSLTEALDLTTAAGRAMAGLLAIFCEFEREVLRERTRAGLAHARENGKRLGRPATAVVHAAEIRRLHRAGVTNPKSLAAYGSAAVCCHYPTKA